MVRVLPPDVPMFLTGFIRRELALRPEPYCKGNYVSNKFAPTGPNEPVRERQVVVRDDGGPDTSVITSETAVGITILAATEADANGLARMVKAIVRDCPGVEAGNPVAAVLASNGPYEVPEESAQHRRYMTFTFSVVGTAL